MASGPAEVLAVGALLRDDDGRVLLVLRANEPDAGTWSLPGGRVEPGEDAHDAVVREVLEETGLDVRPLHLLARVTRPHPDGGIYVIDDFAVERIGGVPVAATDAAALDWFDASALRACNSTPGLIDALESWGVMPVLDAEPDAPAPVSS
jgi:ADP-ribose pyrophosphatase YjhB (NUDIX family)